MKNRYRALILILLLLPAISMARQHASRLKNHPMPEAMQIIMKDWLGPRLNNSHIGIVIQSMKTGKILYSRSPNHLFTPASVLKLFTAVAALDYLKPNFTFKTQLLTNGVIKRHTLKGDLFLKFSGDPDLSSKDLKNLIHQLHQQGIQKISGHVYIDATDFGNIPYPPGWIWDDLSYSYAAPLMTTIINRNYFTLTLKTPGPSKKRPLVTTNLPKGVVHFTNDMLVVKKPRRNCPISIYSNNKNHYTLHGCYYRRWKQQIRKIAIRDVPQYAKILLHNFLKENKINYHGPIEFKAKIKGAHVLAEHQSPPLKIIIKKILKDSDNLMTNAVFKKLGEKYFQARGTWQNSLRAIKKILAKPTGINFKHNLLNDGAGLSRYNLITPRQLSKLLYFAYHNNTVKRALIQALPIGGRDGTMKYRLQDQRKNGRIHMKTGSMTGVTSLAGYIRTKHIGNISLVIMVNSFVKPRKPYIGMENDMCRYLVSAHHG